MKPRFIIVLVHIDMEHGYVGDILGGVGERGTIVTTNDPRLAKRYTSLKRALNAAQGWSWYADYIRVMKVAK
jgi:hypothetical protein